MRVLHASGMDAREVERAVAILDVRAFGDIAVPGLAFLSSPLGLLRGGGLREFIDRDVGRGRRCRRSERCWSGSRGHGAGKDKRKS
jgi:predicted acylesterase/phospholipase RssA